MEALVFGHDLIVSNCEVIVGAMEIISRLFLDSSIKEIPGISGF